MATSTAMAQSGLSTIWKHLYSSEHMLDHDLGKAQMLHRNCRTSLLKVAWLA
jgi:hypothetical protein